MPHFSGAGSGTILSLDAAALLPLLKLNPPGWCRAAERCALLDPAFLVLPTPEAVVRDATGEVEAAALPNPTTLSDHLKRQALAGVARRDFYVAANLIDELDQETGYFNGNVVELSIVFGRPVHEIEDMLAAIASFSPRGCGAQNVHQVLKNQIPFLPENAAGAVARLLLTDYWDVFSGGGRDLLSEISGLGAQAIEHGVEAIRTHLTPYPAQLFWGRGCDYLRRGYYHVTESDGTYRIAPPYSADFCAAVAPERPSERSAFAFEALKTRNKAYAGMGRAIELIDLENPSSSVDIFTIAEATGLCAWAAWLLIDGEIFVDSIEERRSIRSVASFPDENIRKLFEILDEELVTGLAQSDRELALRVSRTEPALDASAILQLRRETGVPKRSLRLHPLALELLGYFKDA